MGAYSAERPTETSGYELRSTLRALGFDERTRGSHHIFTRDGVTEIINLQSREGGMAKPYQVRQARSLIVAYKLQEGTER